MTHRIGDHRRRRHRPRGRRRGAQGRRRDRRRATTPSTFDLGGARYLRDGEVLPDADLEAIRGLDAVLLGAVGTPDVPPGVIERGLLLRLRFELDLYVNLRPFVAGPTPVNDGVDFVVIRENTEGVVRGRGRVPAQGHAPRGRDPGLGQHPLRRRAVRPLRVRAARRVRASTSRSCTRPTCSRSPATSGSARSTRWRPSTRDVATAYNHVDAACIYFVQDPARYDVIVTDNLFGDILTDLGGAVAGGIGRAASANLNPARTGPSLFEPVHGSAPDIAGTGKADPRAAIMSAAMMLEFLGEVDAAARVSKAVDRSDDVTGTTSEIGDAIADRV